MFLITGGLIVNKVFYQITANYNAQPWFIVSNHVTTLGIAALTSSLTLIFNSEVRAEVVAILKLKKKNQTAVVVIVR